MSLGGGRVRGKEASTPRALIRPSADPGRVGTVLVRRPHHPGPPGIQPHHRPRRGRCGRRGPCRMSVHRDGRAGAGSFDSNCSANTHAQHRRGRPGPVGQQREQQDLLRRRPGAGIATVRRRHPAYLTRRYLHAPLRHPEISRRHLPLLPPEGWHPDMRTPRVLPGPPSRLVGDGTARHPSRRVPRLRRESAAAHHGRDRASAPMGTETPSTMLWKLGVDHSMADGIFTQDEEPWPQGVPGPTGIGQRHRRLRSNGPPRQGITGPDDAGRQALRHPEIRPESKGGNQKGTTLK